MVRRPACVAKDSRSVATVSAKQRELKVGIVPKDGGGQSGHTDLRPHQLCQTSDELRRRIHAELERFFIDDLADAVPKSRLQALHNKDFSRRSGCKEVRRVMLATVREIGPEKL